MLACIGEAFEYENEVCGVVVSVRKGFFRISLWTRTSDNQEMAMSIGYVLLQDDLAHMSDFPNQRSYSSFASLPSSSRTLKKNSGIEGVMEFQSHHESTKTGGKAWTV